jgi:nucleoid-associated protein YgaU
MCSILALTIEHPFGILWGMDRTRVRWRRAALAGTIVFATAAGLMGEAMAGSGEDPPPRRYLVQRGDTLWGIARRIVGPEGDPRPLVDLMIEANSLAGASIMPGQAIVVPP